MSAGPHFVVGMPRAGTTYLVHRLNEHPAIAAFGESRFFADDWVEPGPGGWYRPEQLATVHRRLRANPLDTNVGEFGPEPERPGWMQRLGRPQLAELVDAVFDDLDTPAGPGEVFAAYAGAIAAAEGKTVAVEKTPRHVRHIDRIVRSFPQARFVVMVRGPEEFLLSYKHKGDTRSGPQRDRAERRWQPVGVALLWRSYLRHALAAVAQHPSATMLVRNEDLRAEPARLLVRVQQFLGVAPVDLVSSEPEELTNSSFAAERPGLEPAELAWCRMLAGRDAASAGYPIEATPAPMTSLIRAGAGVVPWAVRNTVDARQRLDGSVVAYAHQAVWRRRGT